MQAQYKTYDSYKDSGVDWISHIPSEWQTRSIRAIFIDRNEKNDPIKTQDILSLSIAEGVTPYSDENRGGNKAKNDLSAYKLAYPNDIVLNSMNVVVGAVGLSKYFGAISPVYYALRARNSETDIHFYEKVFKNQSFQRYLLKFGKGILIKEGENGKLNTIRMKISRDDLKTVVLPFPPIDTQNRIAEFLDQKTAEIDSAIEKKQRLIELLKEQKSILINQAVTKGLNPSAPMKDSGIEWIGQIPAHWEVKKLKFLSVIRRGASPRPIDDPRYFSENGEYAWVRISDVTASDIYLKETTQKLSKLGASKSVKQEPGDIFVSIAGSVGKAMITNIKCCIHDGFVALGKPLLKAEYIYHILDTKAPFVGLGKHGTQLNLNTNYIGNIFLPVPPNDEIDAIIKWVARTHDEFSRLTSKQELQIEKLQEFKQTLIAHAVTGKIKI